MKGLSYHKLLFYLIAISLYSCSFVKDVEFKGVKNVSLLGVDNKSIKVKIAVLVSNPNTFKIKIIDGEINVKSKDLEIGDINIKNTIVIPPKSEQSIDLVLEAPIASLFSSKTLALYQLFQQKKIPLTVSGEIKGKALGVSKTIPINQTQDITL